MLTLTFIYIASGICAVGLFAYLGYALVRAEKFWGVGHVRPDVYQPFPGVFVATAMAIVAMGKI